MAVVSSKASSVNNYMFTAFLHLQNEIIHLDFLSGSSDLKYYNLDKLEITQKVPVRGTDNLDG